ncbi:MAG: aminopeptidase P N-terminal domain-containing protein [Vicingaceae bacterium]|nr:aminopeptidase P N-terminal domain-containing protein [Vicingaceae bacterium]
MKNLIVLFLLLPTIIYSQDNTIELPKDTVPSNILYDNDLLPAEFFKKNREALRQLLPNNSVAIFFTNPIRNRSNDVDYEYHQDPNFYYLTGLTEPHAVILIFKEEQRFNNFTTDEIIFLQDKDLKNEMWTGKRLGVKGVLTLGIKKAMKNTDFLSFESDLKDFDKIFTYNIREDIINHADNGDLFGLIQSFHLKSQKLTNTDKEELAYMMAKLREVKKAEEILLMRKAITMTCDAQIELMKALKPSMTEYQSEAIVEYVFKKNGAEYPGFPSIMGGGENSCIIHYTSNRKKLKGNDLLVSDIGAEYHGYTADVTRTIPVDGHFSEEEKIIYKLVLKAQQAGIDSSKAGNKFWEPHNAATKIITEGLLELGIIEKSYHVQRYFMHGTSHYLGLDVHDAGLYGTLQPGNVITVEPGIYIPEGSECDPKWWNIGIRIEDDILITEIGPENLSAKAPRTIEAIEALMKEDSSFE